MNDGNRRENLRDEVQRGDEALRAAEALIELGLFSDAISRAYYGAFHYLRALLLTRGIQPKSHAGVVSQFSLEFIRTGLLASKHNRLLAGLQRARELADYDSAVQFTEEDAKVELDDAQALAGEVRALLEREGWVVSDRE